MKFFFSHPGIIIAIPGRRFFLLLSRIMSTKAYCMKTISYLVILLLFASRTGAQPEMPASAVIPENLQHQRLVEKFYQQKETDLFWFQPSTAEGLREQFVRILEKAAYLGLDNRRYHYDWLKENLFFSSSDSLETRAADKVYTDAVIGFCKDLYQGYDINGLLDYDEISPKYKQADESYIVTGLASVSTANELEWFIDFLQPADKDYLQLKSELQKKIDSTDQLRIKQLSHAMNQLRFIRHFKFEKYVVVNPASAVVRLFDNDTVRLRMKAVVGKKETPTPRFSGYCNSVILYPYWHVPRSIAVNEILPIVKRNAGYLESRNLQVIDQRGNIIDPGLVNWSAFSAASFPYQFRQSTGCDNALGVIKFNLTDPFSVYMHDTNSKTAFMAGARYFSHGCIRLEKPVELAMAFLPGKIDTEYLEACRQDQKPVQLKLAEPVPVFVMYMTAEYDQDDKIRYYKDVYRLLP